MPKRFSRWTLNDGCRIPSKWDLRCEHYARCVSLHGDGFEPLFDDNFFDLLPGETKCIRVLPSPSSGVIYAETAYDQTIVSCQWDKEKEK